MPADGHETSSEPELGVLRAGGGPPVASRGVRQVLSVRLLAAIVAVVGLALVVNVAFASDDSIAEIVEPTKPTARRADVAALVLDTTVNGFSVGADGRSVGDVTMLLAPPYDVTMTIFPGTPGANDCAGLGQFGQCALLAELLGDSIVAFHLVPMGAAFTFELPAIEGLEGGKAILIDGWQVPYSQVIDRSGCDPTAESFSEFLRLVGTAHRSRFSLGAGAITAVVCDA
jgi:hypothetical protein